MVPFASGDLPEVNTFNGVPPSGPTVVAERKAGLSPSQKAFDRGFLKTDEITSVTTGAAGSRASGAEIVPVAFEGRSSGRSTGKLWFVGDVHFDLQVMIIHERDHCRLIEAAGRAERFEGGRRGAAGDPQDRHQGGNCGSAIASLRHCRGTEVMRLGRLRWPLRRLLPHLGHCSGGAAVSLACGFPGQAAATLAAVGLRLLRPVAAR